MPENTAKSRTPAAPGVLDDPVLNRDRRSPRRRERPPA